MDIMKCSRQHLAWWYSKQGIPTLELCDEGLLAGPVVPEVGRDGELLPALLPPPAQ
jgi:hypothetical protein